MIDLRESLINWKTVQVSAIATSCPFPIYLQLADVTVSLWSVFHLDGKVFEGGARCTDFHITGAQ